MEIKKIKYDHKFGGAIVELSQDSFDELSKEISDRAGDEFEGKSISNVMYMAEETEEEKRKAVRVAIWGIVGTLFSMILVPVLIIIGLYQVAVWVVNWAAR